MPLDQDGRRLPTYFKESDSMSVSAEHNRLPVRSPPRIRHAQVRGVVLLATLGIAAVSSAETTSGSGEPLTSLIMAPATRAMATVDFYEGDVLEAKIDIVSAVLGEQGNGLNIGFWEATGLGATPSVTGNVETGYSVTLDDTIGTTYPAIARAIQLIREVSFARLTILESSALYDASMQSVPPIVVLSGGTDAVVPEPGTLVLVTVLSVLFGVCHRRFSASPSA